MPRDRDERGRPRSSRARDITGRPIRGHRTQTLRQPAPELPTGGRDARSSLELADRLIAAGQPFAAHEVLEGVWRSTRVARDGWRGLTQLAVGLTHLQRGNPTGAVALLRRGVANLASSPLPGVSGTLTTDALHLVGLLESGARPEALLRLVDADPGGRTG